MPTKGEAARSPRSAGTAMADALMALVQAGRLAALRKAIREGADPNTRDEQRRTPIIHAAIENRYEVARWLLAHGAKPGLRDRFGLHALHYATWHASLRFMKLLLERMPVESPGEDRTPLFFAGQSRSRSLSKLRLLLSRGADIRHRLANGVDLMHRAAYAGNAAACRELLARGALLDDPDDDGVTPLLSALSEGHGEAAKFLLEAGANPLHRDRSGEIGTALIAAARGKLLDLARVLIAAGVEVSAADANGMTALHHAIQEKQVELVKLLLKAGADPNRKDEDGTTPLMLAADVLGGWPMVKLLLAAGAKKKLRNKEGLTAADIAEYGLGPRLVKALR